MNNPIYTHTLNIANEKATIEIFNYDPSIQSHLSMKKIFVF